MSMEVVNCKRCNKVFQKYFSEYCPDCTAFLRAELDRCVNYLKNNRMCSLHELSVATEVPVGKIIRYINEGKLYTLDYPNLQYTCYFCDTLIRRGHLCPSCSIQFKYEVKKLFLEDGYEYDEATQQVRNVNRTINPTMKDKYSVGKHRT